MLDAVRQWLEEHGALVWLLGASSVVLALGTLIALPWVVASLPERFFDPSFHPRSRWADSHPAIRWTMRIVKNAVGALLVLAGVIMLVTPGQGLLAVVVGLVLVDFPGKRKLEVAFARRKAVWRTLNWIRRKAGKPEFQRSSRAKPGA